MPSVSKSTDGTVEETHQNWSALVCKADLRIISDLFICVNPLVCVRWKNRYRQNLLRRGKKHPRA